MGSALRNVLEKVGLREPTVEDYNEEFDETEDSSLGEVHEFPRSTEVETTKEKESAKAEAAPTNPDLGRIMTSRPSSYKDAPEIGDYLRDNVPVILNLNQMDKAEGQRMVDFVVGLCYGLGGSLDAVSDRVLLLTPKNIKAISNQTQSSSFFPKY